MTTQDADHEGFRERSCVVPPGQAGCPNRGGVFLPYLWLRASACYLLRKSEVLYGNMTFAFLGGALLPSVSLVGLISLPSPRRQVEHVTLRMGEGKCVLIGGLARIEVLEGRPFMLTFFVSNDVRLHPTDTRR